MLKKTNHEDRVLFLKLFTKELLLNSKLKPQVVEIGGMKIEKVRWPEPEKPVPIAITPQIEELKAPETGVIEGPKPVETLRQYEPSLKVIPTDIIPLPKLRRSPEKLKIKPVQVGSVSRPIKHLPKPPKKPKQPLPSPNLPKIGGEVNLKKLDVFLADKAITMIECPGPNKLILVKKAGRVNSTKVSLSQEEIDAVIEDFSKKTRIPVIGGIFKATVEDLTISAIISEFVGSKFIIYKSSPYSMIDQQNQQLKQAQFHYRRALTR